jgi:hypothetical protein
MNDGLSSSMAASRTSGRRINQGRDPNSVLAACHASATACPAEGSAAAAVASASATSANTITRETSPALLTEERNPRTAAAPSASAPAVSPVASRAADRTRRPLEQRSFSDGVKVLPRVAQISCASSALPKPWSERPASIRQSPRQSIGKIAGICVGLARMKRALKPLRLLRLRQRVPMAAQFAEAIGEVAE